KCKHLPACAVPVQRQELGPMPAALADEQHHPVVPSSDEAMGAAKPPRCVYDRSRQSNLRLEATTFRDVHHRQDGWGNRRAADAERKEAVSCAASLAPLTVLSSHHRMGFRPRSGSDTKGIA